MSDIILLLREDHAQLIDLAARICGERENAAVRREMLLQLRSAMMAYARAEEAAVYEPLKALKQAPAEALAHEGYAEHGLLEHLIEKLARSSAVTSPSWTAHATLLQELLERHVSQKAPLIAEMLEHLFTPERRDEMAQAYLQFRAEAVTPLPLRRRA